MLDVSTFSDFVGSMYDCVARPTNWQPTLQKLCTYFQGDTSFLAVHDPAQRKSRFNAFAGEPEKVTALVSHHGEKNPFYPILEKFDIDETASLMKYCDLMGPDGREQFLKSDFARDWAIPYRMGDGMSITLMKQPKRLGTYVLIRSLDVPEFSLEELENLAILAPHMRRAVTIGDLFEEERRLSGAFREVLEALQFAVYIVNADMKLLFVNPEAEELLRGDGLVRVEANCLRFRSSLVQSSIRQTILKGERDELALGGAGIGVPLSPAISPAIAHILPISRRAEASQFPGSPLAAIFVSTAGIQIQPALDAIQALYGLTPAEKRAALYASRGLGATEIAQTTGIAYSTARAQLNAIYDKTSVSKQADLIKLLNELTSPIRGTTKPDSD